MRACVFDHPPQLVVRLPGRPWCVMLCLAALEQSLLRILTAFDGVLPPCSVPKGVLGKRLELLHKLLHTSK